MSNRFKGMFSFAKGDFTKGLVMVVYGAILTFVYNIVITSGFNVLSIDWVALGQKALNIGVASAVIYLFKNFTTTDKGEVAGIIPTK